MDPIVIISLIGAVVLGVAIVFYTNVNDKILRLLLAFSGSLLLSLSFLGIIPSIFSHAHGSMKLGLFVLLGFFIQIFLEYLSKGIEHGHKHGCDEDGHLHINPLPLLIGISLHAFIEGMPLLESLHDHGHGHSHSDGGLFETLLLGVLVHKLPIAVVLTTLFLNAGYSKKKTAWFILPFALAAPLGNLVSAFLGETVFVQNLVGYYNVLMAITVGIFLHVATVILFESGENHKFNVMKLVAIFSGVGVVILLVMSH